MIQAYILRQDVDPWTAIREGKDTSICGDCIHRAQVAGGGGRSCYVQIYPWVTTVWHAYKRGSYTPIADVPADPFEGRDVRVGTYGDPAAVPVSVWEALLSKAQGYTMYTHLWKNCDPALKKWAMASVDSPEEYQLALSQGWRTFRTRLATEQLKEHEIACPAAEESDKKAQCVDCQLCDGRKEETQDRRKNIAIIFHGNGGGWYIAARSELNARSQASLPIVP